MNPLTSLFDDWGQAIWLDFIDRRLVTEGGLERLRRDDGVRGVTSNPSIFQQAIASKGQYDAAVDSLLTADPSLSTVALYEALAVEDIRAAADILRVVYDDSDGLDGFVSLEVSPHLARDTAATVAEARRLWREVARPNLMIKVPATAEGLPAIEELIAVGVNVNATLIFSIPQYEGVARAYLAGLERCDQPRGVASVASFFISRLDTAVDRQLEDLGTDEALALTGGAAVANARLAYATFLELFDGRQFARLANRGARVQRPLWASTSTKNPAYRDVVYVEELIGPDTVNTLPMQTLEAFRDHGRPRRSVTEDVEGARVHLRRLQDLGIDLGRVTRALQEQGVDAFSAAFDDLLASLAARREELAR